MKLMRWSRSLAFVVVIGLVYAGAVFATGQPEAADAPRTLSVWSTLTQESRANALQEIADAFADQHPMVSDVDITVMPWGGAFDRMVSAILARTVPDVATVGQGWAQSLAGTGGIMELSDVIERVGGEDIFLGTSLIPQGSVGGVPYSLPLYVTPHILTYRQSWLDEVGMSPPETWEELYEVSVAVTDPAENRYGWAMPFADIHGGKPAWAFLLSNGVTIFEPVAEDEWELNIDQPNAVEAYDFMYRLARDAAPPGVTSYTTGDIRELIADSVVMTRLDTPEMLLEVRQTNPDILDDFGLTPFPSRERRGSSQGWVAFVGFNEGQQELAKDFMEFVFSEDRLIPYYLSYPYAMFPAVASHWEHPDYVEGISNEYPELEPLLDFGPEVLDHSSGISMWEGDNPWAGEIENRALLSEAVQLMLVQGYTAEQAVEWLEGQLRGMMD